MTASRAVVIGVGNEFRGDDGIGLTVAFQIERLGLPGVVVARCEGDPTELLDIWTGVGLAVVIDAVRRDPATAGRIRRVGVDALRGGSGNTGSHALSIPEAVPLGRALDRVPGELVVVAVEADCFDFGVGLCEPVAAAVPRAVEAVLTELRHVVRIDDVTPGVNEDEAR
ncbi:hydrogenase maturation protease [Nocardia sp. NBC_01377]|uniref:hydrogenase maturation protease n=1 Tax=Nocardia sp. NBC_01377 TaxID=2903595 RepID=UPI00325540D3